MAARRAGSAVTEQAARRRSVRALSPLFWGGWSGRPGGRRYRAARRAAAVLLLVLAGISAARPDEVAPGVDAVVATRDLAVGALLTTADVEPARVATSPDGALADVATARGRRLTSAVRRGEILTDRRLVDAAGPDPGVGRSAVLVRPHDPGLTPLLQSGTPVTVVSVTTDGSAQQLSAGAWVLAVLDADTPTGRGDRPVLLSVPGDQADRVAAATLTGDIALRLR